MTWPRAGLGKLPDGVGQSPSASRLKQDGSPNGPTPAGAPAAFPPVRQWPVPGADSFTQPALPAGMGPGGAPPGRAGGHPGLAGLAAVRLAPAAETLVGRLSRLVLLCPGSMPADDLAGSTGSAAGPGQ